MVNSLALWVGGPLLFSSAGAAFPERYEHQDGGTYRGEWLGMLKQGFGVYAYPSGAKYEGAPVLPCAVAVVVGIGWMDRRGWFGVVGC